MNNDKIQQKAFVDQMIAKFQQSKNTSSAIKESKIGVNNTAALINSNIDKQSKTRLPDTSDNQAIKPSVSDKQGVSEKQVASKQSAPEKQNIASKYGASVKQRIVNSQRKDKTKQEDSTESWLHNGHRERMRKRLKEEGIDSFAPHEVLEMMLYSVIARADTNKIGHRLINAFGNLHKVLEARVEDLVKVKGISTKIAEYLTALPKFFHAYKMDRFADKKQFLTERCGIDYFVEKLGMLDKEEFHMLCLNNRYSLLHSAVVSRGTIDALQIFNRDVADIALRHNAKHVILAHNHPSGDPYPSKEDVITTHGLLRTLVGVGICVVDHIIVAGDKYYSFRIHARLTEEELFADDVVLLNMFRENKKQLDNAPQVASNS